VSDRGVFTLRQQERERMLLPQLVELTNAHRRNCPPYGSLLDALNVPPDLAVERVEELPWLPVRLFKQHVLKSVGNAEVFRVLTSSGTTGEPSRIYLDRRTAAVQAEALARTLRVVLGSARLPMLIADSRAVLPGRSDSLRPATVESSAGSSRVMRSRPPLSARGAAVLGMMTYGRDYTFLLGTDGKADTQTLRAFLRSHGKQPFLIFGFTHLVWTQLAEVARRERFDLSSATLLHTGGWKKLSDQAVSNEDFRNGLAETGIRKIHNYYGMVEATGVIFVEGSRVPGLYCPEFADVIVRDPTDWSPAPVGVPGVLEVVSGLPYSYPGHVLLTEDIGVIHGIDDGDWPGKRFSVLGRLPRAEARGCSDAVSVPALVKAVPER
jgi:hypothetical protein